MKKRNPFAVVVLSIITFGIYDLYWLYKTKQVLNKETKYHVPSIWLLFVPIFILVVGYVLIIIDSINNGSTSTSYSTGTTAHPAMSIVAICLIAVGFISTFIISVFWFFRFSKAIDDYTKGKMSTAVTFLILWLIHLIGVALIQDTFNDMEDQAITAAPMPVAAAPNENMPPPVNQAQPPINSSPNIPHDIVPAPEDTLVTVPPTLETKPKVENQPDSEAKPEEDSQGNNTDQFGN